MRHGSKEKAEAFFLEGMTKAMRRLAEQAHPAFPVTIYSELVAKLGSKAEVARELAYRLYTLCERKKRAPEALAYNGLVQSWPEIVRLAQDTRQAPVQTELGLWPAQRNAVYCVA